MRATLAKFPVAGEIAGFITDYGAVKSAFLRDSEGNILALNELVAAPRASSPAARRPED